MSREISAPTGNKLTCKSWQTEAPMRMLMNNLDPDVARDPQNLIVYGGTGKAARSWESYDAIIRSLRALEGNETLLVQSGKPVGVFKTNQWAPRVLIANSLLVPKWATMSYFNELEDKGLIMYGQMTAGSWIYIGTQGILQGTYETFGSLARRHYSGDLKGKIVATAGLGEMGGAQPLAVSLNGGVCIAVEADPEMIDRRLRTKYLDQRVDDLDTALKLAMEYKEKGEGKSIGLLGNAAEVFPELVKKNFIPDVLTDQTSAHDPLNGYIPAGYTVRKAAELRQDKPERYLSLAMDSISTHIRAILQLKERGAIAFDYGNNIRQMAYDGGVKDAFSYPGFVPAYVRPLFCEGKGPFRWVALSGDPEDIYRTDEVILKLFPEDLHLRRWIKLAHSSFDFQGLPARICWLGYGERARAGLAFNEMVRNGTVSAPIVIGRDHLDCGSVASPNRETEGMLDGSDAIADWPVLNAMLNVASGATWVSLHHGGGVGIGYSIHAGQVIVADGTELAGEKLLRVLTNDPGTGIMRHADAGYVTARENAIKQNIKIPML